MTTLASALGWLAPVRSAVPELDDRDWDRLVRLDDLLSQPATATSDHAASGRGVMSGTPERRAWLLRVRAELATYGYPTLTLPATDGGQGRPPVLQALAQFVCGFHDLDLRDATGLGHGAMAVELRSTGFRRVWLDRLASGALVGIAATERHGGSRPHEITTRAHQADKRTWLLHGEKTWVSRLHESHGFVVFFRDPDGGLSATLIDATHPAIERETVEPAGLAGWSWGILRLHGVDIDPEATVVGRPGTGGEVFDRHFARFRPLVTATALGTAAAVHTQVARTLAARRRIYIIDRVRDNAQIALGRAHGEIIPALLMAIATTRLAALDHPIAGLWARTGKAAGVDTACRAVSDLVPLVGASGFHAASPLIKARNDLTALTYADGIHDSLYRSGGRYLLGRDTHP